jgi:hypothetical protein
MREVKVAQMMECAGDGRTWRNLQDPRLRLATRLFEMRRLFPRLRVIPDGVFRGQATLVFLRDLGDVDVKKVRSVLERDEGG